jgi:hypothetical protein
MSSFWKRIFFLLLILFVAGGAGLFGGVAGAFVMNQLWQNRTSSTPVAEILPTAVAAPILSPTLEPEGDESTTHFEHHQ